MQKIDNREQKERVVPTEKAEIAEIEEEQEVSIPRERARSVLPTAVLLIFGVLACIVIMAFYPATVLGIPLIAVVAFFFVRRR